MNDMVQARTKHIENRHNVLRQAVKSGEVKLVYCSTEVMLADTLTKALSEVKFEKFSKVLLKQTHPCMVAVMLDGAVKKMVRQLLGFYF